MSFESDPPTPTATQLDEGYEELGTEPSNSLSESELEPESDPEAKKRRRAAVEYQINIEYQINMRNYAAEHGHVMCPICAGYGRLSEKEVTDKVIDLVSDDPDDAWAPPPKCPIPVDDAVLSSLRIPLKWDIKLIPVVGRSHPIWRRFVYESKWKDGDGSVLTGDENAYMETMCIMK